MTRIGHNIAILSLIGAVALVGCKKEEGAAKGAAAVKAVKKAAPTTADGAMKALFEGLAKNNPAVAWDFLPASYQKDLTGLVQGFGGKLDAQLYDQGMATVAKAVKVLKSKKAFILANPMFGKMTSGMPLPPGMIAKNWDAVVNMIEVIATSELKTAAGIKGLNVGSFLGATGAKLMTQGVALAKAAGKDPSPMIAGMKVEPVSAAGDKAKLKITTPGKPAPEEEEFIKVEGKWIPAEMAKDWKAEIAKATKKLDMIPPQIAQAKPMVVPMMAKVNTSLDLLASAKDQAAFDAAMMGAIASFMSGPGGPPPGAK